MAMMRVEEPKARAYYLEAAASSNGTSAAAGTSGFSKPLRQSAKPPPLSPENIFKDPNILEFLNLPEDTKTHKRDLDDRSLNSQQMRFVELVIDELSASGFLEPNALYESPFNSLHADGPEGLFAGKNNINDGLSQKLEQTQQRVMEG